MSDTKDRASSYPSESSEELLAHAPRPSDEEVVEEFLGAVQTETRPDPRWISRSQRGRTAIVTGASSGIGRAIALEFASAGVHVGFNYLDTGPESRRLAEETAEELRAAETKVFFRPCDVRDSPAVDRFVEDAVGALGGVHFLVNNAGIGRDGASWRMGDEDWHAVLETNLTGAFFFLRAVAPFLRNQEWGKIVNVSSVHGIRGEFGLANYMSSKAGLIGLTRSAAVELGPKNINVNAVAPGYIRTTKLTEQVPAEILDRAREKSVLGRLGDPRDVASVVMFLCSESARHITGAVIPVDGGYLL